MLANQRKTAAEQARDEAKKAQMKAEHEAARANAARNFIMQMLGSGGPSGRFNEARIIDVLESTSASIGQSLRDQPETEFDVRLSLGIAYERMGLVREAKDNYARAYDLARQTFGPDSREALTAADRLIFMLLANGEANEAESLARRSVETARQKLGEQDAVTRALQEVLATVLTSRRKHAEAEAVYRGLISDADRRGMTLAETTDLRQNFTLLLYDQGKLQEAEAISRELFEREKDNSLIVDPVYGGRTRRVFAKILEQEDKLAQARAVLFELLDFQRRRLGDTHPDTLNSINDCAQLLERTGEYAQALAFHRELLAVARAKGRDDNDNYAFKLHKTGLLLAAMGEDQEAARAWSEAFSRVKWRDPSELTWQFQWWRAAVIRLGVGGEGQWKSPALRSQFWCALDEHFLDNPGTIHLTLDAVVWDRLRFRLDRWGSTADRDSPELVPVAQGGLSDLKAIPDPPPGIYKLSLELPRAGMRDIQKQEFWIVFCPWDVALYSLRGGPLPAEAPQVPQQYQQVLAQQPVERRQAPVLALVDGITLRPGPAGKAMYFGLVASTTIELPRGNYRLAVTSDDGVRLFVDEREVIDFWTVHSPTRTEAVIPLSGGRHKLRVEYFQNLGSFKLWLQLGPSSGTPTTLPVKLLYSYNNPPKEVRDLAADRLLESLNRAVERSPQDADAWQARAAFNASHGRFAEAAADYRKAVQLDPANHMLWRQSAMVCLQLGDVEGYRRDCREMLQRFGGSRDRDACEHIARLCALMPDAVPNLKQVGEIADRAVALGGPPEGSDQRAWYELAKGMVEYRMRNFEAAADWLEKALKVKGWRPRRDEVASLFLAIAQYKRGQSAAARQTLSQAIELIEKDDGKGEGSWFAEWIAVLEARKQAEALIERISPTTVPATQTAKR